MPIRAAWEREVEGFFAASQAWRGGNCHLIVEQLPASGWDWVVWASASGNQCLYGTANTAEEAKHAAEHAALVLRSPQRLFLSSSLLGKCGLEPAGQSS